MADSSEPAFLFLYRKEAVAPVDYLSTFATAPFLICSAKTFWRPASVLNFLPPERLFLSCETCVK